MPSIMVMVPERISQWVDKGEVVDRYYNPGNVFSDVHLVLFNDDAPDPRTLQRLAGDARVRVHNVPAGVGLFARSLGWRPPLLRAWARHIVRLAAEIRPALVRCHGAHLNAYAASEIKRALGVPYVISLHINPDTDVRGRNHGLKNSLLSRAIGAVERRSLRDADCVLPVYRSILPYLKRLGVERIEVAYNALNSSNLGEKRDYRLGSPVRVISVGRQIAEKNPDQLIRAIAGLPGVELTLVGDGDFHQHLRAVARESGIEDRVVFRPAVVNDALCRELPGYDVFATHTEYWELSKSVLEALLTGLPVVLNRRKGEQVPELSDGICLLVENAVEGYRGALRRLIDDADLRERLGREAYRVARAQWDPVKAEAAFRHPFKARVSVIAMKARGTAS